MQGWRPHSPYLYLNSLLLPPFCTTAHHTLESDHQTCGAGARRQAQKSLVPDLPPSLSSDHTHHHRIYPATTRTALGCSFSRRIAVRPLARTAWAQEPRSAPASNIVTPLSRLRIPLRRRGPASAVFIISLQANNRPSIRYARHTLPEQCQTSCTGSSHPGTDNIDLQHHLICEAYDFTLTQGPWDCINSADQGAIWQASGSLDARLLVR